MTDQTPDLAERVALRYSGSTSSTLHSVGEFRVRDIVRDELAKDREARDKVLREALESIYDAACRGLSHVGAANYRERQDEAGAWLERAYNAALDRLTGMKP